MLSKIGTDFYKGQKIETYMLLARATKDGEVCTTRTGKTFGVVRTKAAERSDGTPVWMSVKSFDGSCVTTIGDIKKGDTILAYGRMIENTGNDGNVYRDIMADAVFAKSVLLPLRLRPLLRSAATFPKSKTTENFRFKE